MGTSDTIIEHTPWRVPPQFIRKQLPAHSPRSHLKFEVPWIVNQFQKSHGRIVTQPVIDLDNTRVTTWAFLVPLRKCREKFWQDLGLEEEALGASIGSFLPFFPECDNLPWELDSCVARFRFRAFSASLAASLAFGSVVRICSCSNKELTRFLGVRCENWSKRGQPRRAPKHQIAMGGRPREFSKRNAMLHC